jgi:hypothetical protein
MTHPGTDDEYTEALALAADAAARLGTALARFDGAIKRLVKATPKCGCGWALGHHGGHRRGYVASEVDTAQAPSTVDTANTDHQGEHRP